MADQSGGGGGGNVMMRDYRKGNWNVNETMVLIEAKKMDDERRTKRSEESGEGAGRGGAKPSEPRWKWVEDFCWGRGCSRSQNQCNDKWDNLMRDYKKVREYERRRAGEEAEAAAAAAAASYWKMEKSERKERNLPTNMMPQIYEALVDVVERRAGGGGGGGGGVRGATAAASASVAAYSIGHPSPDIIVTTGYLAETPIQHPLPPPQQQQQQHVFPGPVAPALPPPSQTPEAPPQLPPSATSQPLPTPESEPSEHSDSPAKRRRRGGGDSGGAAGSEDRRQPGGDVGTAISRSASIIADALQACDEREERRHRDLVGLHERRLKLEESKAEISRQGIDGLVSAINKLASSIHALASSSSKNQSSS